MKTILIATLCLLLTTAQAHDKPKAPREMPRSLFLTPDNDGGKDAHIGFSAVIGAGLTFQYRDMHWTQKTALCMIPGAGKEVYDYVSGSGISKKDLLNDALGCLTGIAVGSGLIYLTTPVNGGVGVSLVIPIK